MHTVGRLARQFGLSRSTLLYYDSIGLLRPPSRAKGDYRRYGPEEVKRLGQICLYRRAGLSLKEIARVLEAPAGGLASALERRLEELNRDIARLRQQQRFILTVMKNPALEARVGVMNRRTWVELLAASGFSEEDMRRWHAEFERLAPDKHREFLEFLCIPAEEIALIRQWSRQGESPGRPGGRAKAKAGPACD